MSVEQDTINDIFLNKIKFIAGEFGTIKGSYTNYNNIIITVPPAISLQTAGGSLMREWNGIPIVQGPLLTHIEVEAEWTDSHSKHTFKRIFDEVI